MRAKQAAEIEADAPTLTRKWQDLRAVAAEVKRFRLGALQLCESILDDRLIEKHARSFFAGLPDDERHYWIASLYALLMPPTRRRRLAVYFTPPHLAQYAIDVLIDAGVRPGVHRILDPASGGAAFLVPLASRIAKECRRRGLKGNDVLCRIEGTLAGIEVESELASLSMSLLRELLSEEMAVADRRKLQIRIECANSLTQDEPGEPYDAVIGNPPYGRIFRPSRKLLKTYAPVITDGYARQPGSHRRLHRASIFLLNRKSPPGSWRRWPLRLTPRQ